MNEIEVLDENMNVVAYITDQGVIGGPDAAEYIEVMPDIENISADIENNQPEQHGITFYWKRDYGFHSVHIMFELDGHRYNIFKHGIPDGIYYRQDCPADVMQVIFCNGTDESHSNVIDLKGPGSFWWNDYQQNTVDPSASPEEQEKQRAQDQAVNWSNYPN